MCSFRVKFIAYCEILTEFLFVTVINCVKLLISQCSVSTGATSHLKSECPGAGWTIFCAEKRSEEKIYF